MIRCLLVDPQCPDPVVLDEAVAVLRQGGVIAYPTDTVYGLAADVWQPEALARLYAVKGRPVAKALPVIIGALAQLTPLVTTLSVNAQRLIEAFWPGPLTLLLPPHESVPPGLLGDSDRIGVRWPNSMLNQQLALGLGGAITASSANRSGAPVALSAAEVAAQLAPVLDLILDGGPVASPEVSTILDITSAPPCLLRAGRISVPAMEAVLGTRILVAASA
jgi:L-threonylcarbamoyladenylate synthase